MNERLSALGMGYVIMVRSFRSKRRVAIRDHTLLRKEDAHRFDHAHHVALNFSGLFGKIYNQDAVGHGDALANDGAHKRGNTERCVRELTSGRCNRLPCTSDTISD